MEGVYLPERTFALRVAEPELSPPSSPRLLSAGTQASGSKVRESLPLLPPALGLILGSETEQQGSPSWPLLTRVTSHHCTESEWPVSFSAWGHRMAIWGS